MSELYPVTRSLVKSKGVLYPITYSFVKKPEPEDLSFVIYGDSYIVGYLSGEVLNFTIDWGDGTQTVVDSTDSAQRAHTYSAAQEWTITIKKYISGWIQFYHASDSTQAPKLRRVLSRFPASITRESFQFVFRDCSNMVDLPSDIFANNPNITSFGNAFYGCTSLGYVDPEWFRYNTKVTTFAGCFLNCTSIPALLSDKDGNGMFHYNTEVTTFTSCFYGCTNLSQIIGSLWSRCLKVTTFQYCFRGCTSLGDVPYWLFANNPAVIDFSYCFYGCRNMHFLGLNFHQDVLNRDIDYNNMFYVSSTLYSHTGYAPELWLGATTTASYKANCFRNNTALTNYTNIPTAWR